MGIKMMYKSINGKRIKMTDAEITAHNQDVANVQAEMKPIFDAIEKKNKDKISGKQKLKDLGLSDDEVKALLGV
tara:strand:- start:35 stop:256 length:222 start_codon:yes stop_codon:yes gene_type:complete